MEGVILTGWKHQRWRQADGMNETEKMAPKNAAGLGDTIDIDEDLDSHATWGARNSPNSKK